MSDKGKIRKGKDRLEQAISDANPLAKLEITKGKVTVSEITFYDKYGKPLFVINDAGEVYGFVTEGAKKMTHITEKNLEEEYYYW